MTKTKTKFIVDFVWILMSALISLWASCEGPAGPPGPQGEQGPQGEHGSIGNIPYIGENGNWWIGGIDTGINGPGSGVDESPNHTDCLIDMVRIPAGTFTMGSPETEPNRSIGETPHKVTLSKDFYMGKYPVTQSQYEEVMGSLPNLLLGNYGKGGKYPVYYISWYDALVFCNKLSILEGLDPVYSIAGSFTPEDWGIVPGSYNTLWNAVEILEGNGYCLPTEAQWEYACRAGTETAFNWGTNQITTNQANYNGSITYNGGPKGLNRGKTVEAETFAPNAWGLFDMHGNINEWCFDWYGPYDVNNQTDPAGSSSGTNRVLRGGSYNDNPADCRSASRYYSGCGARNSRTGLRLVRP